MIFQKDNAPLKALGAMVIILALSLPSWAKNKNKKWNKDTCKEVYLTSLKKNEVKKGQDNKIYVLATFVESDGTNLKVKNSGNVYFQLASRSARNSALKLEAANILIFGFVSTSSSPGQIIFRVKHVEKAPTNNQLYVEKLKNLQNKSNPTYSDWIRLGEWAIRMGYKDRSTFLINRSKECFKRAFRIKSSNLNPKDASDIKEYVNLVEVHMEINSFYEKLNREDLKFPKAEVLNLIEVVLDHRPNHSKMKKVLRNLDFIFYKNKYRTREEFKQMEGFVFFKGENLPGKKYKNVWVTKQMHKLLEVTELRVKKLESLRDQPPNYYTQIINSSNRRFVKGMNRSEIIQLNGYPDDVLRIFIQKTPLQLSAYEIWQYGKREDQYICFEDGRVFYFPDTFTPIIKK